MDDVKAQLEQGYSPLHARGEQEGDNLYDSDLDAQSTRCSCDNSESDAQKIDRSLTVEPATLEEALVVIAELREQLHQQQHSCQQPHCDEKEEDCGLDAYFGTPLRGHLCQRLPWLMVLLLLESVSAYSLGHFESMLSSHMTLALFCPMIVGTAGNAGNQPGVIFTRAVTTGQFKDGRHCIRDFFRREAVLSVIVALVMSLLALFRTIATSRDLASCLAVSISIFVVINFAIGSGLGLSLAIHRCGCDPAAGASPVLTTLSDVIGVLVLCLVSMAIFQSSFIQFGGLPTSHG